MNNNHLSPNAISHKELNTLMTKAKKDISTIDSNGNHEIIKNQELNDFLLYTSLYVVGEPPL